MRGEGRGRGDIVFPWLAWGTTIKPQLKEGLGIEAKGAISMNN